MIQIIIIINLFKAISVLHMDTDSFFIEKKHWEKINKPSFLGDELGYERNDFGFYDFFPALLFIELKTEKKTYKGFKDTALVLDKKSVLIC